MSRLLYVSISFSTLHQKRPGDLPSASSSGPPLMIGAYEVTDKYGLESGYGDPGENPALDVFDYSEFAIDGASFRQPSDFGANVEYMTEGPDGTQDPGTKGKYHTVWVPEDFTVPADVGPLVDATMDIAVSAFETGAIEFLRSKGMPNPSNFITAYGLYDTVASHMSDQLDLIDLAIGGNISLRDYEQQTTQSMIEFRNDLEQLLSGVAATYVDALTAQGMAVEGAPDPAGLSAVPFDPGDPGKLDRGSDQTDVFLAGSEGQGFHGRGGDDMLVGGNGNDHLRGGGGDDRVVGGGGDDTLHGSGGDDTLRGGDGSDTYLVGNGHRQSGTDIIDETGGSGEDVVIASYDFSLKNPNVGGDIESLIVDRVKPKNGKALPVDGTGNGLDNLVAGNAATNVLKGLGGNDILQGLGGKDRMIGAKGNDILYGGSNSDVLIGGRGADLLLGGKGQDTASYEGARHGVSVSLVRPQENTGEAQADNYQSIENLRGSSKSDTLVGDHGHNVIRALEGSDTLFGSKGRDILYGGSDRDRITGGKGGDLLEGGNGQDMLAGGMGKDKLSGNRGKDTLVGNAGNDLLVGGRGEDRLIGGEGRDVLTGGLNADLFIFKSSDHSSADRGSRDVITDFSHAHDDRIKLKGIDAVAGNRGNQAFDFIGDRAFGGTKGELRIDKKSDSTFVYGDVDGDANADLVIKLDGRVDLVKHDFVL